MVKVEAGDFFAANIMGLGAVRIAFGFSK
jgi:hypothetical protein